VSNCASRRRGRWPRLYRGLCIRNHYPGGTACDLFVRKSLAAVTLLLEQIMRFLMKVNIPVESGNAAAKAGKLGEKIQAILSELKPEAVYFAATNGQRTGFIFLEMQDASQIPAIAEPWFLAFNASIEIQPVMIPEDLAKAGPAIEKAVKKYG
jgi:hypothetical protein